MDGGGGLIRLTALQRLHMFCLYFGGSYNSRLLESCGVILQTASGAPRKGTARVQDFLAEKIGLRPNREELGWRVRISLLHTCLDNSQ